MLQQSTPESRLSDAAWLDGLMREYTARGGRIQPVAGFAPKPRPARFHPEPKPKPVAKLTAFMQKKQQQMHDLRQLALAGYTLRYARLCLKHRPDPRRAHGSRSA